MIITNLVVALMIVSTNYVPVRALPLDAPCRVTRNADGTFTDRSEIMFRRQAVTNFVYSTSIKPISRAPFGGNPDWIPGHDSEYFMPWDLFGCEIKSIYFFTKEGAK